MIAPSCFVLLTTLASACLSRISGFVLNTAPSSSHGRIFQVPSSHQPQQPQKRQWVPFSTPSSKVVASRPTPTQLAIATALSPEILSTSVSTFYQTFPLLSAVLTCTVEGSLADLIVQFREKKTKIQQLQKRRSSRLIMPLQLQRRVLWKHIIKSFCPKRNMASVLYSGVFMGTMCEILYNRVYPIMFGHGTNLATVLTKVLFDALIVAPLFWLPPAYLIKAVVHGYSPVTAMQDYVSDVRNKNLLSNYRKVWVPVQVASFTVIPKHLRVAFFAVVSLCWLCFFSALSSNNNTATTSKVAEQKRPQQQHTTTTSGLWGKKAAMR